MESALVKWFQANQERVNVSGELVKESATKILDQLYLGHEPFKFSSGWLEAFKSCHGIRSYRRFGESDSMLQPHFRLSVRMKLTLPKVETWSPPRLPKTQSLIAGVKTPCIGVFIIPLESS